MKSSHPPLVSVEWLEGQSNDPDVVVLDASVYLSQAQDGKARGEFVSGLLRYLDDGHLPGARFADLFTEFSDPTSCLPFTCPQETQFAEAAGKLGIDRDTHVVIYDGLAGQWAARLWWVFRIFGHPRVSVLDGGLKRYLAQGGRLETNVLPHEKRSYRTAGPLLEFAQTELVAEIAAGRSPGTLICLLQPEDFSGDVVVRRRGGHIPRSVNLPFTQLLDGRDNTLLSPAKLRSVLQAVTPLAGERVVTYCGGGIASTVGALALAVIGYDNTQEYDGSLEEWMEDSNRRLVTGPV